MALPDSWTETCLVGITKSGDSEHQFAATTDTVDIDWGEKGVEFFATCSGGRIVKYTPETDTRITLEMYPAGIKAPDGITQLFLGDDSDSTQPISVTNTRVRYKFRVSVLWTEDTTATEASGATAAEAGVRFSFLDCYCISAKPAFTDDILKVTAILVCPAFNKAGTGRITSEESDGSEVLPALGSY